MPYKYEQEISTLTESDGSACYNNYVAKDCKAYRWVFADINDSRNFVPITADPQNSSARKRCSGYAISFHETEDASEKSWEYQIKNRPNKHKKIGTHMAVGTIKSTDGACGNSDEHLHFNFAEYKGVSLVQSFKQLKELATPEKLAELLKE